MFELSFSEPLKWAGGCKKKKNAAGVGATPDERSVLVSRLIGGKMYATNVSFKSFSISLFSLKALKILPIKLTCY